MATEDIGININNVKTFAFDVNHKSIPDDVLTFIEKNIKPNKMLSVTIDKTSSIETINIDGNHSVGFESKFINHHIVEGDHHWYIYCIGIKSVIIRYHE